jgi:hypothetical protein
MPPTSEPKPTPPQVLISLASEGARQAARACVMAMRVPPTELAPGPQLVQRLRDMLHAFPSSAALVDLAHLQAGAVHIAALAAALPDASQRERIFLVRENAGLWPADVSWARELGFAGLWGQIDAAALTGQDDTLAASLATRIGLAPITPLVLSQYFSALRIKPDPATPRGRIRAATGLPAESLCNALATGVKALDRVYRLTTYPSCHTGTEAVDWLCERFRLQRDKAVQLGVDLQALGLLQHVVHEQPFADRPNFYRLTQSTAVDRWNPGVVDRLLREPTGVAVADRKYLAKTYANCFVGSEAVSWVAGRFKLRRHEAEILLNRLHRLHLIEHVTRDHPVRDGNFFYRFVD